jgi:hypothetical protein
MHDPLAALKAWLGQWSDVTEFVELVISRTADAFELRHRRDAQRPSGELRELGVLELRDWVQTTGDRAFRPNKLAPNLRDGWCHSARGLPALNDALRILYPGALADWFAEQQGIRANGFREYFGRQTGMYRVTQQLTDDFAARAVHANCAPESCRRRRIWEVPGLPPDSPEKTSLVPCFEPCGTMMEMARRMAKAQQGPRVPVELLPDELESALAAVRQALESPDRDCREGDLAAAENPRRLRILEATLLKACERARPEPSPAVS